MNSLELIKLNKHYGRKHALKIFIYFYKWYLWFARSKWCRKINADAPDYRNITSG